VELAYLSLGSNLANRRERIQQAIREISFLPETEIKKISSLYRTQPVGLLEQPCFYNLVLEINTKLCPTCLLLALQAVESQSGRVRTVRWGPRTIDIDILSYGKLVQNNAFLILPHPRMAERNFVLIPFNEIAKDYIVPQYNQTVGEILARTADQSWVKKLR
jgi:2-amino-4-hydroxy-6-hydroxymethyldihydropteridine diphosphokinase